MGRRAEPLPEAQDQTPEEPEMILIGKQQGDTFETLSVHKSALHYYPGWRKVEPEVGAVPEIQTQPEE